MRKINERKRFLRLIAVTVCLLLCSGSVVFAEEEYLRVIFDPGEHGRLEFAAEVQVSRGGCTSYVPQVVVDAGYELAGWSTDGEAVVDPFQVTIEQPTTFSAVYRATDGNVIHRAYLPLDGAGAFHPSRPVTAWELREALMVLGVESQMDVGNRPDETVTRGELARVLRAVLEKAEGADDRAMDDKRIDNKGVDDKIMDDKTAEGRDGGAGKGISFSDLSDSEVKSAVALLLERGIVSGYGDGTFRPNAPVTRAEAAAMLNRALDREPDMERMKTTLENETIRITDVSSDHWAYPQIVEASREHAKGDFHQPSRI